MKDVPSAIKNILTAIAVVMIVAIVVGCCMFFSEKPPTPTDPPTSSTTAPITQPDPSTPDEKNINFNIQGYLANEDHAIIGTARFVARGPLPEPTTESTNGTNYPYIEITGFPVINSETVRAATFERKNNILTLEITKDGIRTNYETGKLEVFREARYIVYLDSTTLDLLMCSVDVEDNGTFHTHYFVTSENTNTINEIMLKAYTD